MSLDDYLNKILNIVPNKVARQCKTLSTTIQNTNFGDRRPTSWFQLLSTTQEHHNQRSRGVKSVQPRSHTIRNITLYTVIYSRHVRRKAGSTRSRPYPRGGGKHVLFPELEAVHLLQDHPAVALALEEVGAGEDGGGTLGFASLDQHCRGHVVGLHTPKEEKKET